MSVQIYGNKWIEFLQFLTIKNYTFKRKWMKPQYNIQTTEKCQWITELKVCEHATQNRFPMLSNIYF